MAKNKEDRKLYLGNPMLKGTGVKVEYTQEQIDEYMKCANDPVYFAENYIKIVNVDDGLVPFKMYPFQKKITKTMHKNRFTICKISRQNGKTTTIISYVIHSILFNENYNVAILANKLQTAREILDRLKLAYENLPKWMQQGVVEWNKRSIQLENGSKVMSSATSSSAVRGGSYNLIVLDEFAFIQPGIAEEFFSSVYPTISSGKTTKMVIISTPNGMNMFYKLWMNAINKKNSYVPVEAFWNDVPGRDAKFKAETIANTSEGQWAREYECVFQGADNCLISGSKLASLPFTDPIFSDGAGLDVYEYPIPDHIYTLCVDTSEGLQEDFHAMCVIDTTKAPYKLVAKYRNATLSLQLLPDVVARVGYQYNKAQILVEINNLGETVANALHNDNEYENLIMVSSSKKRGQKADGGFGGTGVQYGLKTSPATKKFGCQVLKDLIEKDGLLISDFQLISELSTFVSNDVSYEAAEGYHDDLTMCLVTFAWLTSQPYFKDYTNTDVRQKMFSDKIKQIEESIIPFGFIDDGVTPEDDGIDIFDERNGKQRKEDEYLMWKDEIRMHF